MKRAENDEHIDKRSEEKKKKIERTAEMNVNQINFILMPIRILIIIITKASATRITLVINTSICPSYAIDSKSNDKNFFLVETP